MSALANISKTVGRIDPSKVIFLCCDIQESFRARIHKMEGVVSTASFLLDSAKAMNVPVVVTEQYPKGLGHTVPDLDVSAFPVIAKSKFSMMVPEVEECFAKANLPIAGAHVVLFGIEAHVCVQQTALDLLMREANVHVVVDATSSQTTGDRDTAMQRMMIAGAKLTTAESVVLSVLQDAKHPNFKAVSNLLKERKNPEPLSFL